MGLMQGKTVVCIGSGPSLTQDDCDRVEASGLVTIVINSSWMRAPFAHYLYAGDYNWWKFNHQKIGGKAERWTSSYNASVQFNLRYHDSKETQWHSGLRAVKFAEFQGAAKVILLGFDCSVNKGVHWHGEHPHTSNPQAFTCNEWRKQFAKYAKEAKIPIINCSRETALTCFPRANLEETLCSLHSLDVTLPKTNLNCVNL